jgi:cell division protease FtsH
VALLPSPWHAQSVAKGDSGTSPPAPRGDSPRRQSRPIRWNRIIPLAAIAFLLLGVNWWTASRVTREAPRVRIPYSPMFIDQVEAGNVASITSRGTAIQGSFKRELRYPPSDTDARETKRFRTEIPSFADGDALSALLQRRGVVINAEPLERGLSWWRSLLFGFGPTLLFLGLFLMLIKRGGAGGMLGAFGRSRARRYEPSGESVTFADVAGIDEAKAELTEVVDFLKNPEKYRRLGGRFPAAR